LAKPAAKEEIMEKGMAG